MRLESHSAAALEAEILLARSLGVSRSWLFAHREAVVGEEPAGRFGEFLERRAGGEPLAYITGEREFWSLPLRVSPAVLIPRPETELLVETALSRIPAGGRYRIADLGTGSGAIALALAGERPNCQIFATDISWDALEVARQNGKRLGRDNVRFLQGWWLEPLSGTFDAIVSNPPYIAEGDPHLEQGDVRFEPQAALLAGRDGLDAIRAIAGAATSRLVAGGWLMFEHGHDQSPACADILRKNDFTSIETLCDLEGTKRVTVGRLGPG